MKDFISDFMRATKNPDDEERARLSATFINTTDFILNQIGQKSFRLKSGLNVALFDALMVAVAEVGPNTINNAKSRYDKLIANGAFQQAVSESTTNIDKVQGRIKMAIATLSE